MLVAGIVAQQPYTTGGVGDEHIGMAVVVDVTEGSTEAHVRQRKYRAGSIGHIVEFAIRQVTEQLIALVQRERIPALGRIGLAADLVIRVPASSVAVIQEMHDLGRCG